MVLAPGVNPFWSAAVRHGAMVEHAMDVPRPDTLPPLAGPPRTFGPVQALGDGAQQSGPVQALSTAGPVQALGSSGLAQAQVIFFKVGVLYRPLQQHRGVLALCRLLLMDLLEHLVRCHPRRRSRSCVCGWSVSGRKLPRGGKAER